MRVGQTIAERFALEELAGEGGMGKVFRAIDRTSGETVALKTFGDAISGERAKREIEVLSGLDHPGIVRHIASGVSADGELYLAMEWLEGQALDKRIGRGALRIDDALQVVELLAEALAAVHAAGVVHRDVKPENVLLVGGEVGRPKLVDFGAARLHGGTQITSAGAVLGSPAYMSPEQARALPIDGRSDLFSLGVLLFEAVAGRRPFHADHPIGVMAKILIEPAPPLESPRERVPPALVRLVGALLEKEPDRRPASAADVARALAELRSARDARSTISPASIPPPPIPAEIPPPAIGPTALGRREMRLSSVLLVAPLDSVLLARSFPSASTMTGASTFEKIVGSVELHGAQVERLVDGALLVLVRDTGEVLEQAARAARCALSIHELIPRQPMVLVSGRSEHRDGVPVGDLLDRGARLLARRATRSSIGRTGVAIDDVTAGFLERQFSIQRSGAAIDLVAERTPPPAPRDGSARAARLVGREEDLADAIDWLGSVRTAGRAGARVVPGGPGTGKSRFAGALRDRLVANEPSPTVVAVRVDPGRASVPLGLMARIVEALFEIDSSSNPEVARRRLRACVGLNVPRGEADRVACFLGELLGIPVEGALDSLLASARADRIRMGDQIRAAWHDLLAAELEVAPLVFILDDAHHADAASLEVLGASLKQHADRPLALVALLRTGASLPVWPSTETISLGPLGNRAARLLATAALGGSAAAGVVARIVDQAEGIPLAIEELARAELEGRAHRTPPTLLALAQARLAALDDEDRRYLRAGSIFRGDFGVDALAALIEPEAAAEVPGRIEGLVDRGLLVPSNRGALVRFAFGSAMVREAAYAMLTDEDRALGHRLAADFFAQLAGPREAPIVAYHFDAAGDAHSSAIWFGRAAELALEANEFDRAAELAARGALAGATGALLGRLRELETEAYRHAGRNADMLRAGVDALDQLPPRTPPWWTAYADAVLGAIRLGQKERLAELATMATALPLTDLPAAAARAAHYLQFAGLRAPADALLAAASRRLGPFAEDPALWAWAYRAHATKALLDGNVGGYLEQLELSVRAFATSGDVRELTLERANVGFARVELGLYEAAEEVLREAIASAERLGLAHTAAVGKQNLGNAVGRQGRLEDGQRLLEEALARFTEQKNARMSGNTCAALSRMLLARGRAEEALEQGTRAIDHLALVPPLLPSAFASVALSHLALGDVEAALAKAEEGSLKMASVGQVDEGDALVRLAWAETLEAAGRHDEARSAITAARTRLLERASRLVDPIWRASFLERVAENRRTLELAEKWLEP